MKKNLVGTVSKIRSISRDFDKRVVRFTLKVGEEKINCIPQEK